MATIQGVYVALFGRPADPAGLAYFNSVTGNGANLSAIGNLAGEKEYTARFENQSNIQVINTIYQSLFNRSPDAAGLEYFASQLNAGKLTINNIAIAILDGAQGDDKAVVTNKVAAADAFTKSLDTAVKVASYSGTQAVDAARALLTGVTKDASSIPNAEKIAATLTTLATAATGGVTLNVAATDAVSTTATEAKLKSTNGDDTINVEVNTAATSVAKIDAGFGTDTVVFKTVGGAASGSAAGTPTTLTATPEYTSVEKLVLTAVGGAGQAGGNATSNAAGAAAANAGGAASIDLKASKIGGLKEIVNDSSIAGAKGATGTANGSNAGGAGSDGGAVGNVTVTDIANSVKLGLKGDVAGTTSYSFKESQTGTTSVSLEKAVATGTLTVLNGSDTVALATTGGSSVSYVDGNVATLTVTGSGDLKFTTTGTSVTNLAKVDASALDGKLAIDFVGTTKGVTVTGTKYADSITLDKNTGQKDTVVYTKAETANFATQEKLANFASGEDKIDLKAFAFTKTGVTAFDNIVSGASFGGNSVAVNTISATEQTLFVDSNNNGTFDQTSDLVIKLTGLSAGLSTTDLVFA